MCVFVEGGCLSLYACVSICMQNKEYVLVFEWKDKRAISILCVLCVCVPRCECKHKVIGFCFSKEWVGKVRDKCVSLLLGYLAQSGC